MYHYRYQAPRLTGVIQQEYIRCGKVRCRCERGQKHGPYFYLYYRAFEAGRWKMKKEYVKAEDAMCLQREIQQRKEKDREAARFLQNAMKILNFSYQRIRDEGYE